MKRYFARKKGLFRWLFHRYAERRVRKTFGRALVRNLDGLQSALADGPVIAAPNHVAFWDVFSMLLLERALGADAYALMDRVNYDRLGFFAFIGALPLDRSSQKKAYRDLNRALPLLDRPGRLLFIFPQGRQVPARLPLKFHTGVAMAARLRGVPVVPIGLRYEFGEDPKPDLLASVGAPLKPIPSDRQMVGDLERAVAAELDVIDRELASPSGTFSPLLATRQRGLPVGSLLLSRLAGARKA